MVLMVFLLSPFVKATSMPSQLSLKSKKIEEKPVLI